MRRRAAAIIAATSIALLGGTGSATADELVGTAGDPSHATFICGTGIPENLPPFFHGERLRIIQRIPPWSFAQSADRLGVQGWSPDICLEFGTW